VGEETPCRLSRDGSQHCDHWYDADGCCWCGDPAMTDEELLERGIERG
jgi:hypothetical protein